MSGYVAEKIVLLDTIVNSAKQAKAHLLLAAAEENILCKTLTRYQDLVQYDVDTFREVGDDALEARKVEQGRAEAKSQRLTD